MSENMQNPEATDGAMIERGMQLADNALEALKNAGLIHGYVIVLEVNRGKGLYAAEACCAAHLVEMVDADVAASSDDPHVQDLVMVRTLESLHKALDGSSESSQSTWDGLVAMGFREPLQAPSEDFATRLEERFGKIQDGIENGELS